jgi:hypothetical protein
MEKSNVNKKKSLAPQIISNNDKKLNPYNLLNNNNMKYFHNKYLIKIKEKRKYPNKTLFDFSSLSKKIDKDLFKRDIKLNNYNEKKENNYKFNYHFNSNKFKKSRCCSQEQNRIKIESSSPKNNANNNNNDEEDESEHDDCDINLFFDKINKEFDDIGKLIKMVFVIDNKRKYEFIKNEFIILKIIENELRDHHGIKVKEFIYKDKKLNLFKSLKDNNLENNCIIKVVIN